ncbi:MAG: TSUP family transporter, partial [Acetobacteraceae bacterium]
AVGLMMLTAWLLFGETRVKALNAPRTLLVVTTKSVAVAAFVAAGIVRWPETLAMLAGGLAGGAAGARLGRIVPARYARPFTLVWMAGMTGVFFWRAHLR